MAKRPGVRFGDVHRFVEDLVGEDLHAKRVYSLANATLGVISSASPAVHAIGQGLALARGLQTKHAVKQLVPEGVALTVVADRGGGDQKLYRFLSEKLGFGYVIRFRRVISVTDGGAGRKRLQTGWDAPGWAGTLRGVAVFATAILDRLLHRSHLLNIKGRSYRLRDLEQALSLRG